MEINIFRLLSIILACAAFIKAFIGFFFHERFYAWDLEQYSSERPRGMVVLLMIYAVIMLLAVWMATIFFYRSGGWILTLFLSLASVKSVNLILRWPETSAKFAAFIRKRRSLLLWVDVFVLAMGGAFLFLAFRVY